MKFFNFLADILQINDNPQTRRREPAVFIVVHRPGQIGHQPCVPVKAVSEGFDWDSGAILIYPEVQLTELTAEQVNDITQSVRKEQSWHAMEQFKQYRERLDQAALEHARLLTERDQVVAENAALKSTLTGKAYIDYIKANNWCVAANTVNGKFASFSDPEVDFGSMAFGYAKSLIDSVPTPATDKIIAEAETRGV